MQSDIEKIKEIAKEFFEKTGLAVEALEVKAPKDFIVPINLKIEEPQILIGEQGQTLTEVQRLLGLVLKKKINTAEPIHINLDINSYKEKKNEYLKEMARSAADEAVLTKAERALPPMSAYERRIIHTELASRSDVTTESIGEEPETKIVIKHVV